MTAPIRHPLAEVVSIPPEKGPFGPLEIVEIKYIDFGGQEQVGYLQVHPAIVESIKLAFFALYQRRFPIFSMMPVPFEADGTTQDFTYEANGKNIRIPRQFVIHNTVGFVDKARTDKTSPSHHAYGLAFDLNPQCNPLVRIGEDGEEYYRPLHGRYTTSQPGTITLGIAKIFKDLGFHWGGDWVEHKDYMHFSWGKCQDLFPDLKPEIPGLENIFT